MHARDVSKGDIKETLQLNWQYIRKHQNAVIDDSLEGLGVDHFGALAVSSIVDSDRAPSTM